MWVAAATELVTGACVCVRGLSAIERTVSFENPFDNAVAGTGQFVCVKRLKRTAGTAPLQT